MREDVSLDFDWGSGSPGDGVPADKFSASWTRYIYTSAGTYRFAATSDDGVRVYVDDQLLINDWSDYAARTVTADTTLSAGHHLVRVEYYENGGQAVIEVSYSLLDSPAAVWSGSYFNNTTLTGTPILTRDDAEIAFNWGASAPATGVHADGFSVRWKRSPNLSAGMYRFTVTADDGVRLWVNGHLLVDQWKVQAATTYQEDIYLPGGVVPLQVDYFENTGLATVQVSWTQLSGVTPPAGVVVDNGDPGFVKGGIASSWRLAAGVGYSGDLHWTYNNDITRDGYNWGRWYPDLAPGRYEVFVFIPSQHANTHQARYWIAHEDGYTLKVVDQFAYSDEWVSLGTYDFRGTSADYVSLSDVTYESYLSKKVAWDAMMWTPK